jgi:hypothetical protein
MSFVTLVSSDNVEFVLPVGAAKRSGFVSRILKASKIVNKRNNENQDAAAPDTENNKQQSNFSLPLPDINSSVLDIIVEFLCDAENSYQNRKRIGGVAEDGFKPIDVSSALQRFDPKNESDRVFVMELMMACDYLGV